LYRVRAKLPDINRASLPVGGHVPGRALLPPFTGTSGSEQCSPISLQYTGSEPSSPRTQVITLWHQAQSQPAYGNNYVWSEPCSQPAEGNNYVLVGALLPAYPKVMTSTGSSPAPCSGPSAASPGTLPQTAINSIHLTLTVEHTVHNTDIRLYLTYLNVPKSHSKKKPGRNIKKKTFILKPILTTDLVLKKTAIP